MAITEKPESTGFKLPDPEVVSRSMADIAERSQRIVGEWLKRQKAERPAADPFNIGNAFLEMTARHDGQPGAADAGPARLLAGLHDALAEHRASA